ncbi:MAG: hypothetical protein V4532_15990 [Pseudomonadota bacterium]
MQDYILIQTNVVKGSGMGARTWGGEVGGHYAFNPRWKGLASLAYVNGQNKTDRRALGQMSPLESRLGVEWSDGIWSTGSLLRLVAGQHRYAVYEGNIVGQDLCRVDQPLRRGHDGYGTTTRLNEPGRTWWAKVQVSFD